jgi:flavin-binding protein dodecin
MAKNKTDVTIARVTEIIAASPVSFEEAVNRGIERAAKRLRNVRGAWVKQMKVDVVDGKVSRYRVNLLVSFVLDD